MKIWLSILFIFLVTALQSQNLVSSYVNKCKVKRFETFQITYEYKGKVDTFINFEIPQFVEDSTQPLYKYIKEFNDKVTLSQYKFYYKPQKAGK